MCCPILLNLYFPHVHIIYHLLFTILEPDKDEPQEMGNCDDDEPVELTDEQMDEFNSKRSKAMGALSEAEWQKAVDLFTEAIKINSRYASVDCCFYLSWVKSRKD